MQVSHAFFRESVRVKIYTLTHTYTQRERESECVCVCVKYELISDIDATDKIQSFSVWM